MALKFSQDLKQYEDDIEIYDANERIRKEYVNIIDNEILEFIRTEAGLYDTVPKQYQDKVWSRANEDGHSSGMYEVYLKLCNLVEIFE
jgi:uncharacterized protein YaaW (UPF0174 family)